MKKKQKGIPLWINPFFVGVVLFLTLLFLDIIERAPKIIRLLK